MENIFFTKIYIKLEDESTGDQNTGDKIFLGLKIQDQSSGTKVL